MLIEQVPEDSALIRKLNPGVAAWRLEHHLLALIADELGVANWQRTGDSKVKRPEPIRRPGVNEPAPPIDDVDGRLRRLRDRNRTGRRG